MHQKEDTYSSYTSWFNVSVSFTSLFKVSNIYLHLFFIYLDPVNISLSHTCWEKCQIDKTLPTSVVGKLSDGSFKAVTFAVTSVASFASETW